jgi:hypothetical protein
MRTAGIRLFIARLISRNCSVDAEALSGKPRATVNADGFVQPPAASAAASVPAASLQGILMELCKLKKFTLGISSNSAILVLDSKKLRLLHTWPVTHLKGFGTRKGGASGKVLVLRLHGIREPLVLDCPASKAYATLVSLTQAMLLKATREKDSLSDRLQSLGFAPKDIEGDGNCQFRAVADQLFQDQERHAFSREQAVLWLQQNGGGPPEPGMSDEFALRNFLDVDVFPDWASLVKYHSQNKNWGDHITLVAIANQFKVSIVIFSSLADAPQIRIDPSPPPKQKKPPTIYLFHWHGVHYGSLQKIDAKKTPAKKGATSKATKPR